LLQRIVGVYELDVDTVGSSKKRREDKSNFTSISFEGRLMESERIESDSEEPEIGPQSESVVERPL
jgi:putative membrane protein